MSRENQLPRITKFVSKQIIEELDKLKDLAMQGNLIGFAYAAKHAPFNHSIGIHGEYFNNPICAKRVVDRLAISLEEMADKMEVWS